MNKKLKSSGEASLAEPAESNSESSSDLFPKPPDSPPARRTRATSALEEKLIDICGLRPLLTTKGFSGSRFGRTLSVLRDLKAEPAELDRFVSWWRNEAISYKRSYPTLEQVANHFHESRPKDYWPPNEPARDEPPPAESRPVAAPEPEPDLSTQDEDEELISDPKLDPRFACLIFEDILREAITEDDQARLEKLRGYEAKYFPGQEVEARVRRMMERAADSAQTRRQLTNRARMRP